MPMQSARAWGNPSGSFGLNLIAERRRRSSVRSRPTACGDQSLGPQSGIGAGGFDHPLGVVPDRHVHWASISTRWRSPTESAVGRRAGGRAESQNRALKTTRKDMPSIERLSTPERFRAHMMLCLVDEENDKGTEKTTESGAYQLSY